MIEAMMLKLMQTLSLRTDYKFIKRFDYRSSLIKMKMFAFKFANNLPHTYAHEFSGFLARIFNLGVLACKLACKSAWFSDQYFYF